MGGMSSLPYSPPTRAKGMWKALLRLKEFSLTATPLRSPSTSKFQENPDETKILQVNYDVFCNIVLRPFCTNSHTLSARKASVWKKTLFKVTWLLSFSFCLHLLVTGKTYLPVFMKANLNRFTIQHHILSERCLYHLLVMQIKFSLKACVISVCINSIIIYLKAVL